MSSKAPTAAELEANPLVRAALDAAWSDSLPTDRSLRHEEGGWIYFNPLTGELRVIRAARGSRSAIDLRFPPELTDCFVVAKFHTHPNPTSEGWHPGPSESDTMTDELHGVPDLIRADDGVHFSGPAQRRGGLAGNAGYPALET
jgi:hypothetical protein